ncbi:alpha/beta hydrolase [Peristeroidobacter agariperforans]|uniref:alpha/beta hydrolase n=1 Tax=Peristeroidobacter agariperforans TaxID=268404 RepID=UPI00101CD4F3|nr:alpha/beta hydrolase [Peristeroidobacter agariperforans]
MSAIHKRLRTLALWGLAPLTFCSAFQAHGAGLELEDCRLQSEIAGGGVAARCGWLSVPENRENPSGKQLRLHVAVVRSLRTEAAGDPLFVLSGGPGQAASDFYISIAPALARIRRDRDIVIVDQRGTGRSNRLDCTFPDESDITFSDPQQLRELTRSCLARLPGDPRYYTTSVAVRDLDDVRAALGYQRLDLYGVSYGTRVAQHYMRRYPQRVRVAILDGVVPPQLPLGPDVALDAQAAIDSAFARCDSNVDCKRTFPNIAGTFATLRTRVLEKPVSLSIPDPLSAEPTNAQLGAAELSAAVRLLSYSDETLSTLPLLIHEAELGQPQGLAAQYLMIKRSLDTQIANGMHFAVVCSEDAPRWHEHPVSDAELAKTYIGETFMQAMRTICEQWPRGPVDEEFSKPLQSAIPTLVLSGGNDPVTPARYGEQVVAGLKNARHLVLDGQGHGQIAVGCMPRVVANFIAAGNVKSLDDECLKTVAPAPFLLSRSAPAP